jgi:glycosyltransferase involved in cell wall biosynthesis
MAAAACLLNGRMHKALADAILQFLDNPDRHDAMAASAFKRASTRFSWDRIAEDLLEEYDRRFV